MDKLAKTIGGFTEHTVHQCLSLASKIPGSSYIGRYIEKSHQNDPGRTIFEIILFVFALRYFLASKQSYTKQDYLKLTEKEVDELCSEWEPAPLVKPLDGDEKLWLEEMPNIDRVDAPIAYMSNGKELVNFTSPDYYGHSTNRELKDVAKSTVRRYGVGACGPANFYGNEDVHIRCEQSLSTFLGTEKCILYSQGMNTSPSVIPCFAKRGDILIVDDAVNMSIQRGLQLSRAKVFFYVHNDMEDLEAQILQAKAFHRGKKLPRRYILTEGLFEYTGNSPDLKTIVELKHKHKFRIILDESWSLGVLGSNGRGLCEEQGVDRDDIDVTLGTLATAMGVIGGFCAGSKCIVDHQRIVSLAYTFSATEPPFAAAVTSAVVSQMKSGALSPRIRSLREKAKVFTSILNKSRLVDLISRNDSPMVIFRINGGSLIEDDDSAVNALLHAVVMLTRERGLLISRLAQIAEWETFGSVNAIKLFLPESLTNEQVRHTADTLVSCIKKSVSTLK